MILRHVVVEAAFHLGAQSFEHFPLLSDGDGLKDFQICRVDREQPHELFQSLGHAAVERDELLKMLPNLCALLVVLGQQPLGNDVGHVLPHDANLLETILYPAQALGYELEFGIVEQTLLKSGDETESDQFANLTDFPKKTEIEDEIVLLAGAQVVKQLVHDEKETVVGIFRAELLHHVG